MIVDDEPDVELLFRQQFRCGFRSSRFAMEFASMQRRPNSAELAAVAQVRCWQILLQKSVDDCRKQ